MPRKYTHEEASAMVLERCNVKIIDRYPGCDKPWRMLCLDCHKHITPSLANILKGKGACKYCAGNVKYTHEEASAMVLERCNVKIIDRYPGCDKPWRMLCLDCHKHITTSLTNILKGGGACKYCAAVGGTNPTTLGRDPQWRWSPSHLYVRRFDDNGRTLYKVGIGTSARSRASRGHVMDLIQAPRGVAFLAEQRILESTERIRPLVPLHQKGDTEVIGDYQAALDGLLWMREQLERIVSDDDRRAFDDEHFPGCVPVGCDPSVSVWQLELFAA